MEDKLKQYDLKIRQSDNPDREPIDFSIEDNNDNVCWVWGSHPVDDVQVECDHPEQCIDYGDDDEQGECVLCGAKCDWHWEKDVIDNYPDSIREIQVRVPHEWYHPRKIGGLVKECLDELKERW